MSYLKSTTALAVLFALSAAPAFAQNMPNMDMPAQTTEPDQGSDHIQDQKTSATSSQTMDHDMSGMDMSDMDMSHMDHMNMGHMGDASKSGWQVMSHAVLNFVADNQEGPRGGSKNFVEGMAMIMASRELDNRNTLDLNLMLSPDAFMGKGGYPLLLQTGETADGVHHLVDAQHPHDLFMGATAKLTHRFDGNAKAFVLIGWPGEFGFGPTAFMHRASGENFPTAPITHHWLDSGHITMGVVTAGLVMGPLQFEVTQFTGREPDQYRFNLDTPKLDSTAVRLTWQVSDRLTAQASGAHQVSPEQLAPDEDLQRRSVSFDYNRAFRAGTLYSTLAWGRKEIEHSNEKPSDGYLFENTFKFNDKWMALGRHERVYNDELVHDGAYWVSKTEIGAIRTFDLGHDMTLGLGLVRQFNEVPDALKPVYGDHPNGTVGFLQFKIRPMSGSMTGQMSGMKM